MTPALARQPREASAAEILLFRENPEGDDLVREWGGANSNKTARHVGAIRAKMRAAVDAMSPADREEFGIWYDGLSEAEARAALRALVA